MADHETGYAAGIGSISAASIAAGWVFVGQAGVLAVAYYILSTTEVETAPAVTFVNGTYTPNNWTLMSGYIR